MPVVDLTRLLASRLFWEVAVLAVLVLALVTQAHRIDRWRGMVRSAEVAQQLHALNEESQARQQTIDALQGRIAERDRDLGRLQAERDKLAAQRPIKAAVAKQVQRGTVTDAGLLAESRRVLPGIPLRFARRCD